MKTKTRVSKQILSVLLCIAMLMSYVPMTAVAAEGTEIDLSTLTETYVISDSGEYIFTGSGSYGIKVESGNPTIILNNASIKVSTGSAIDIPSGSTTTIQVIGDNTISTTKTESWNEPCGGIFVAEGGTVNITSNGTNNILRAHGTLAAAIGGKYIYDDNESYNAGNISISNVTVYAYTNNYYAAAIGAAGNGTCGTINITNAVVYAYGAGDQYGSAPGIGSAWGLVGWPETIPVVFISDSEVHTYRYNSGSDYIGYFGDVEIPMHATGSINCGGGSVTNSTIYCYTGLTATTTDKVVKYGALGGLLKEDGTCEGQHSGGTQTCMGYKCANCGGWYGEKNDTHDWSGKDGICANACGLTCSHESYTEGVCNVCGYVCVHSTENDENKDTCTTKAVCDLCGAGYGEFEPHSTTAEGDKAATCTTKAYCSVCQSEYGGVDKTNHAKTTFTYEDNGDGTTHTKYHECCGVVANAEEEHSFSYTVNEDGTHTATCDVCGYEVTEDHSGGDDTATCEHGKVCDKCSEYYGDFIEHHYSYTADDEANTITVTCDQGCGLNQTVKLSAPENAVYAGKKIEATVTGVAGIDHSLTYDVDPVNAGDYTATLTVGNKSVSVEYTIAKATPTYEVPTGLTATYGDTLADVDLPAGWTWKDEGTTSVGNAGTRTFKALYNPDSDNYNTVEADVTIDVAKADIDFNTVVDPVFATGLVYNGTAQALVTKTGYVEGGTIVYSLSPDGEYTTTIPVATEAGEYVVYWCIKGDENHNDDITPGATYTTVYITDATDPTGEILIKDNAWKQFLNWISFGLFCKDNVDVIVTADGTGSAVAKVEYLFSTTALDENNLPADGWTTVEGNEGTYKFAITAQNKGAVYVKITDVYGNVAIINSDGIVVYTDSNVTKDTVYFTYQSTEDVVVELELNGNTVKNVLFNGHEIAGYWSVEGNKLTLDADYLGRLVVLKAGDSYPVTVYFNPLGVETESVELKDEFGLVIQKAAGSVTNISDISKTYDGKAVENPTYTSASTGVATFEYKEDGADDNTYTTTAPITAGTYIVRVTVAADNNYKAASNTATFTISEAKLTDVSVKQNATLTYNGGNTLTPSVDAKATAVNNQAVTFTYSTTEDGTYGSMPSFTEAKTYTVYFKASAPNHETAKGSFTITVDKAVVTEPTIASKPYTGAAQVADIVDTDLYTVEQNNGGAEKGSYDVVPKLRDTANYKWATTDRAEVTVKFVISAAANAWNVAPSISGWTYGETAKAPTYDATFGNSTVKVTYTGKANDGTDYDSETAPTKAGNYTAAFTVEGTEDYSALSESVNFTIAKATYDMSSAKWDYTNAFKYDGKEHKVEIVGLPAGVTVGGYNGNTATVVGDYTAKVTLTYDANNYNTPSVADLNWKVENNWTPTEYTLNGEGWMNQDFVITANDGYKVSLTNTADGEWSETLTGAVEGENSITFYVKNETTGAISLAKTVSYKVDKTAPTGKVEFVERTGWENFLNTISFGLFYKEEVTVKITSADNLSGVAKIEYYASNKAMTLDEVKAITGWTEYNGEFGVSVEDAKKFVYFVRITDNAGNMAFLSTDGAEYDITAPVIEGIDSGKTYYTTQKVTVTDKNLDTVTLNGETVTGTVTLEGDKDATYTIVATDKAGHSTTITVTMKTIKALVEETVDLSGNVNSDDTDALNELIAKLDVLIADPDTSDDGEQETLEQYKVIAESRLQTIEDTKNELARINEELGKYNGATVNSNDAEGLKKLGEDMKALLDGDNLTEAERTALTEDADKVAEMEKTVADTTAENDRISDKVTGYDLATVTSDDKADLEQLLADIDKQLESTNLTEEEISELNGDKKAVEDLLTKIKGTDELIDSLTEDVNGYSDDTVKSTDKDAIEQIIEDIDTLLETENLTEDEKKALEDAKAKAEGLLETIDEANKATDTENTEKVEDVTSENVTPDNKTDLEKAKEDLEKALEDNSGNYTEDEKKAIEDEIKRIDDALEVIENVENAEELIGKIPENITKNDEAAIRAADEAYNALSDYEKSLVDEDVKKALDDAKAALAELNKPTDPNSPQTGDNSNLWLWFALLFVSGTGIFAITAYDRKRKAVSK